MEIINANNFDIYPEIDQMPMLFGNYDKKQTGKRIPFRTGIFEKNHNNPFLHKTPFYGRGWHADFRSFQYHGDIMDDKYLKTLLELRELTYIPNNAAFCKYYDHKEKKELIRSEPELIIYADSYDMAISALRLIPIALSVTEDTLIDLNQGTSRHGYDVEEIFPAMLHQDSKNNFPFYNLSQSIRLAARATHSRKIQYAMTKYWTSKKLCSVDVNVSREPYSYAGIRKSPVAHALFSQAIVSAYGSIAEFDLDIKGSNREREVLEKKIVEQLTRLNMHPETQILWSTVKRKRKIDKDYALNSLKDIDGSGSISARWIKLSEAIYFVGRLRSKLSAHAFKRDTAKLTAKDVWNAQNVARYIILHRTKTYGVTTFHSF